jgi:nucleoside-diphosphate-sugar epimerase
MKVLVTGGGGYLGGAVVRALTGRGDEVASLQRGDYPGLKRLGIAVHKGDMTDRQAVIDASRDCDLVMHIAGMTGVWGAYADYYRTNVTGTRSVIDACVANGVRKLVYTSSPSVVFDGRNEENIDETAPYPGKYFNHYQSTKAEAEQMVLAANNDWLSTVALRPHLIWGPGDPHLIGRIISRARSGRLRLARSRNLVDTTYIDNAVDAHLAAADRLDVGAACAGKAYFISNGEPLPMAALINRILNAAGLPAVDKTLPDGLLYLAGGISEWLYGILAIKKEPAMTRFIARQLACAHWYNINAAKQDLGYRPRISIEQGMKLLEQYFAAAR